MLKFDGLIQIAPIGAADVGAESDFYTMLASLGERGIFHFNHSRPIASAAGSDVCDDEKRWHPCGSLLHHFVHFGFSESDAVLNGIDASAECGGDSVAADGVRGDFFAKAMGLIDDGS